jgi:hypothetical protein
MLFAASFSTDGVQRDSVELPSAGRLYMGRIEAMKLHLQPSGVYLSGITFGTMPHIYRYRGCSNNQVNLNGGQFVCGSIVLQNGDDPDDTGCISACMDAFVLRLRATGLTQDFLYQIVPASCDYRTGDCTASTPGAAAAGLTVSGPTGCTTTPVDNFNNNKEDELIDTFSCEQNVPSLSGSSC